VGFEGYPHYNTEYKYLPTLHGYDNHDYAQTNYLSFVNFDQLDVQGPLLLQGIEWVFTWLETTNSYMATILYESTITPTDLTALENLLWTQDCKLTVFLSLCFLQDLNTISQLYGLPTITNWYNAFNLTYVNPIFNLEHVETTYYYSSSLVAYLLPIISKIRIIIELESVNEGVILIPFIILDVLLKLVLFGWLIMFVFFWYNTSINDNNVDSDFLVNSLTIESEEEIASIDDTVVMLIVIFFIFGWFFLFNYLNILTYLGEVMFIFLFLPLLMYILFLIPVYLLFDYGMYFLSYLRGASSTSSLLMEFVYDCIAFLAFFIRLSVQNVRLLLITLTFFSLYEFILFFVNVNWFNSNFENLTTLISQSNGYHASYYYFLYVVNKVIYWIYELLHTFFVTIAQFVAFFAMVFWLFLFLYTMFVVEEFEKYLDDKRKQLNLK